MVGSSSRSRLLGRLALTAGVLAATAVMVSSAVAAPPLETVLQVGKAESHEDIQTEHFGTSGCPLQEGRFTLYTLDGKGYGSMSICYTRARSQMEQDLYSATLTLNLRGGRIVAEAGSSLLASGPPVYADPSERCAAAYLLGGINIFSATYFVCRATVIDATGVYAGMTGMITFEYAYEFRVTTFPMSEFAWTTVPRLTIDLEPAP